MTTPKKNSRLQNIIKDLASSDEKKVLTALKQLRKHGKKEAIEPLIKLLSTTNNATIQTEIEGLLFDLKDQNVVEEIVAVIKKNNYPTVATTLIAIFWQSSLYGSTHLSTFVQQAITGDYMVGVEVLSVIDNFEATFQETEVEDLKFDLDEAIEEDQTEKKELLISIRMAVDGLNLEF